MATALMIAHPGHELRVYDWLKKTKPIVCILTDGSGSSGQSRLASSSLILKEQEMMAGDIYGRYTDAYFYSRILARDQQFFLNLVEELYNFLIQKNIQQIVGDAWEGYNPTHDICRILINVAVKKIKMNLNYSIENYSFNLEAHPVKNKQKDSIVLFLDSAALTDKKLAAYRYLGLNNEIELAVKKFGQEIFEVECLTPIAKTIPKFVEQPYYEKYGEQQVKAGHYSHLIRYQEHILPIINSLDKWMKTPYAITENINY